MATKRFSQNGHTYKEYDTDAICEMADPEVIAECLGLETRRKGKRISILCPDHNDQHFFSCYLTERGYHCFSCGSHGSVISLVQKVNNCSFRDACSFICNIIGDKDGFWQDTVKEQLHKHVLSDEDLRLIGLKPRKTREGEVRPDAGIYKAIAVLDERDDVDLQKGQRLERNFLPVTEDLPSEEAMRANNGYYVLMECVDRDPLRSLLQSDEEFYCELIRQKAEEAKARYQAMVDMAKNPATFYSDEDPDRFIIAYYCHDVAHRVGMQAWIAEMTRLIRRCEDICINFGSDSKEEPPKKEKRRSIFGKIHA